MQILISKTHKYNRLIFYYFAFLAFFHQTLTTQSVCDHRRCSAGCCISYKCAESKQECQQLYDAYVLYYSTVVFAFLLATGAILWFSCGLMYMYKHISQHNKSAQREIEDIKKRIQWRKDQEERKQSEFLVVRDYVELQNKKRNYVESKMIMKKEEVIPKSVQDAMRRTQEKQKNREKAKFQKAVGELYQYRRRLPKSLYLPKPLIENEQNEKALDKEVLIQIVKEKRRANGESDREDSEINIEAYFDSQGNEISPESNLRRINNEKRKVKMQILYNDQPFDSYQSQITFNKNSLYFLSS